MKICGKKLLSLALAVAMSGCMVSAYANTVEITNVKVLSGSEDTTGTAFTKDGSGKFTGSLSPEQLLQVTVKLSGDSDAAIGSGDVSFLSYASSVDAAENSTALDNSTIQYVDQKTSDAVANENYRTATITFRPRLGAGSFVAKAGGTDVSAADSFSYEVKAVKKNMTLTAQNAEISVNDSAVIKITDKDAETYPDAITAVKVNNADIGTDNYSYADGRLTISNIFTEAKSYEIVVEAENYNSASVNITAKAVAEPSIPEDKRDEAKSAFEEGVNGIPKDATPTDGSYTLPEKVTLSESEEYRYKYTLKSKSSDKVALEGNQIKLNGAFAARVEIEASIGAAGDNINASKTIYIIPEGTSVSYGNLNLVATSDGADAFASDAGLEAVRGDDSFNAAKAEMLSNALNITLGRDTEPIKYIVDYDKDGKIVLAEYRIFKLMLDGDEKYVPTKLQEARQKWIEAANK